MPPEDEAVCGHEHVIGNVAYRCERAPHPVDGYGAAFRHVAVIDAEQAKGTDEGDGEGPATLATWGEDSAGDGQDWEVAWGPVERRRWERNTRHDPPRGSARGLAAKPGRNALWPVTRTGSPETG